ncbi:MAG TPA: acyltransferase [Steroidobacteraceae bacterium]|nr:acyltransferase [Steroidobacteraceae bacterium]
MLAGTLVCFLLSKRYPPVAGSGRFLAIDGLRGYLALSVFLHHSCIWYFYLRTGKWDLPPSQLYAQLAQNSVALFFMITGFLFYSKLLQARHRQFDWQRLYLGRVLRLTPLYLFAMALMLSIVLVSSAGQLHDSPAKVALQVFRWLSFAVLGAPDINNMKIAQVAVARVVWTLRYEWVFYLTLPVLALTVGARPSWRYLLLVVAAIGIACYREFIPVMLLIFAGGMLAAVLARLSTFCTVARSWFAAILAIASLGCAIALFPAGYGFPQCALLAVFFCIIASGNDLFGLLARPTARKLGEMAYSVYLLHGLVLYVTFIYIVGAGRAKAMSPLAHWVTVIGIVPVLLLVCHATYRFIEYPFMQMSRSRGRSEQSAASPVVPV